jgi:hypothetical protein
MNKSLPFNTDATGLLVGDELDRCPEYIQNAFLQILLGGEIHGNKISPNAYVCGTMNGSSDMYTTPLSEAARTRICSLFVSNNADGFSESYDEWASKNGVSAVARTFSKYRKELFKPEHDFEELALCVPRSIDMADRILAASKEVTFQTDDILFPMIAGVIGKKAAVEFLATERLINEAPSIDDVIANPTTAMVPSDPSIIYALTCGLVDAVSEHDDAVSVMAYAVRLPDEYTAAMVRRLGKKVPSIVTDASYQKWVNDNQAIL